MGMVACLLAAAPAGATLQASIDASGLTLTDVAGTADELGDPFAMLARGSQHAARDAGALEPELEVVLPGEADAAEDLERGGGHCAGGVRGAGLGHRCGKGQRLGLGSSRPGGVIAERA